MLKTPRFALAVIGPICILLTFSLLALGAFTYERKLLIQDLTQTQIQQIEQRLFRLSHVVASALNAQEIQRAEQEVSFDSADLNVMVYILVDRDSRIQFANHAVWRDSKASQVIDGYQLEVHQQVLAADKPLIKSNPLRLSIQAYYPLDLDIDKSAIPKVDLIYVEYDLSAFMHDATEALFYRFLLIWGIGLMCVLGLIFITHFTFIRPLNMLVRQAKSVGKASFSTPIPWASAEVAALQRQLLHSNQQLHRTLKQARDSEQRWLFAVEGSRNGIWDWNIATNEVFLSDRWKEMIGYEPTELEGVYHTWESRLHPDDRDNVTKSLMAYVNGEIDTFESVHRLRHKQGHYIWVLDRGMLVDWDADGRPARIIGTHTDVSDDVRNQHTIEHQANHDPLTNLANRRGLMDCLYDVQQSMSNRGCAALFVIDLDNFKTINDALGHHHGDRLLIQVAARLSSYFSTNSLVARLGGDEFVILARDLAVDPDAAVKRALALASEVRQLIARTFNIGDQQLNVSASVGICLLRSDEVFDPAQILKRADLAMYQAKERGRDGCAVYSAELEVRAKQNLLIQTELRHAIELNQLSLVYQPIVDTTGHIASAEALLRWHHPVHGHISPAEFIPIAEGSGLIVEIGQWVILQVCDFILKLRKQGIEAPSIAINVSARHFNQPEFAERLIALLAAQQIKPGQIELELTEYALLTNLSLISHRMKVLRGAGISISIDDFGTGYSSLSYLQSLPLSRLKIDAAFVSRIGETEGDNAIVKAIIDMAHSLKLKVVAEGVETRLQSEYLSSLSCDSFQGYLYSRPLVSADFCALLDQQFTLPVVSGS